MEIYIILPALTLTGPVKGGIALANFLSTSYSTNLVFLKGLSNHRKYLNPKVNVINLEKYNCLKKFIKLNKLMKIKNNKKKILLSMCFSADLYSLLIPNCKFKISSIRGNLFKNYYYQYGITGLLLALFHLVIQNFFSLTLVMNKEMYNQVSFFSKSKIKLIKNFIEENKLKFYFKKEINKSLPLSYIFVGGLNKRKDPLALIYAFEKTLDKEDSILHIVGDGPLMNQIKKYITQNQLTKNIIIHGFLDNPYEIVSKSDVFIMPSHSEGTPRAAMEALFLGVPCILRNVEGNNNLIVNNSINGKLFSHDDELPRIILEVGRESRNREERENLLPSSNSQSKVLNCYKELFYFLKSHEGFRLF